MTQESLVIPDQASVVGGSLGRLRRALVGAARGTSQIRTSDH